MESKKTRVAALQMESQGDLERNLIQASSLIASAKASGADVAVLPENFAWMGDDGRKAEHSESFEGSLGPIGSFLRDEAKTHGLWLIGGGLPEKSDDPARPFNSCVVFAPSGEAVATYRKIHLFDVELGDGAAYRESKGTQGGRRAVTVSIDGATWGLSICYDLRFPELYRRLVDLGAEVLIVPAAFTLATGKDHWFALLRARAIESQCYVVAAAQCGLHPGGRRTFGKSCVIDPWGDVIAQCSDGVGVVTATIDLAKVRDVRRALPSLTHRKMFE